MTRLLAWIVLQVAAGCFWLGFRVAAVGYRILGQGSQWAAIEKGFQQ